MAFKDTKQSGNFNKITEKWNQLGNTHSAGWEGFGMTEDDPLEKLADISSGGHKHGAMKT